MDIHRKINIQIFVNDPIVPASRSFVNRSAERLAWSRRNLVLAGGLLPDQRLYPQAGSTHDLFILVTAILGGFLATK
jgi:hypothetical protein